MLEEDKVQHFMYSFFLVVIISYFSSLLLGVLFSMLVGLAKEIYDHYFGSGFCYKDMWANVCGICLAMVVLV
ncbi:hypothetical protein [Balneatrix alpica]|uniref:Uncharacterized protein n=1 Tax=Balneatrix alpica TaxID=75684 RepID=A0ABV5ZAW6_9GAMM|nr:hypothetical protein [Balneatrix alpica]